MNKNGKPLFLILCILCLLKFSSAQQWYLSTVPFNKDVNAAFVFSRNSMIFAGGDTAFPTHDIFKSKDFGANWTIQIDQANSWIKSIIFNDTLHGYSVGDNGLVLKTTNGGNGWAYTNSPGNFRLNKVWCASDSTIFVFGGNTNIERVIFKSVDAGHTWALLDSAVGACLRSAFFINAQKGFAVGDSATILMTTDSGNTWLPVVAPVSRNFSSITFINPDTGFIAGGSATDSIRSILRTTNAGLNWSVLKDEPGNCLTDISFADGQNGFAVGDRASIFKSTNGGQTWVSSSVNGANNSDYFTCVKYFDPAFAVIGSQAGRAFVYTNTPTPIINTIGESFIDSSDVSISATLNTQGTPSACFVQYGTDSTFTVDTLSYNVYITSDTATLVTIFLHNLTPYQTYYYRPVAYSILGNIYGQTKTFFTVLSHYTYRTDSATGISPVSATLNATISGFPFPLYSSFDFDTTPNLSSANRIYPAPQITNDTLTYHLTAMASNLKPGHTYYFRWNGDGRSFGGFRGNTLTFFTSGKVFSSIKTLLVTNSTDTSARFNGEVSGALVPLVTCFDYGPTLAFGNHVAGQPVGVNDSLLHYVGGYCSGLHSGTRYYCRFVVQTADSIYYADTTSFYAGVKFITLAATGVNSTSAQLNGLVHFLSLPTTLSFEYSSDTSFSNAAPVLPSGINDSAAYYVTASVSNLVPNQFYNYRLKGTTNGLNFYSNVSQLYAGNDPILNWDFENWEWDTLELPHYWKVLAKGIARVPGHSGNYAAKLYGANLMLLGDFNDAGGGGLQTLLTGGQAFPYRPDSMIAYLNYNLATGDSGIVMVKLHGHGVIESFQYFLVGGNSGGTFKRFAFPLQYNSTQTPDSLVLAFTSTNLFTNPGPADNNSFIIDDISFVSASTPVINGDFESWYQFSFQRLQSWYYLPFYNADPLLMNTTSGTMISQALFSAPNDYAAEIRNTEVNGTLITGTLSSNPTLFQGAKPSFPVPARHQTLNGYYKFFPVNGDTLVLGSLLYKNGNRIAQAFLYEGDSVPEFKPFSIPFSYFGPDSLALPDSGAIDIECAKGAAKGLSYAIIDKLSFDGFANGITVGKDDDNSIGVYPSPAKDFIMVEFGKQIREISEITLFDLSGNLITALRTFPIEGRIKISISNLASGMYIIKIQSENHDFNRKIAIIK